MSTFAITGASGYIGQHLLAALASNGSNRIKLLSRSRQPIGQGYPARAVVEVVNGDLRDLASLDEFLEPGCTVVNLAYLKHEGEAENLAATENLLEACKRKRAGRLIHCSTAMVAGRVAGDRITEEFESNPVTNYAKTKLKIEQAVVHAGTGTLETVILRPTAVLGVGGENLKKLADDLVDGSRLRNYLKSCLFGRRRMNLVAVENVVAAILFLASRSEAMHGEVFIVSDADLAQNNFIDIERMLMQALNVPDYRIPRVTVPPAVLAFLLERLGQDSINPAADYSPAKLLGLGFKRPHTLQSSVSDFANWYLRFRADENRMINL